MFKVIHKDENSKARRGCLTTEHGEIETPCFMPVGTQGTVKSMSPDEMKQLGASIILGNAYHLYIRPGLEIIGKMGGLHEFINWDRPILTDSGGFQVFSLAKLRKVTPDGVHFQSHIDGTPLFIGPKESMRIQRVLGSDIVMAFDQCPALPATEAEVRSAVELTMKWAKESKQAFDELEQGPTKNPLLFGIVQGGAYENLRKECASALVAMDFPGYAVGGVSVGEPEEEMIKAVELTVPHLPESKPRYTMGLGQPNQLVKMVARGVDMFDCVLPTRVARNGTAYTRTGTVNLRNAANADCGDPIEEGCGCYACQNFSRAYIRHLLKSEEILGLRLVTWHNLFFYLDLMRQMREAIEDETFGQWSNDFLANYKIKEQKDADD